MPKLLFSYLCQAYRQFNSSRVHAQIRPKQTENILAIIVGLRANDDSRNVSLSW